MSMHSPLARSAPRTSWVHPTSEKLSALAEQVAAGRLRVEIERTFPLSDASAAIAAFASGKRGKLVLVM